MAKTKEVAFKRGGDNKLRKTGNVGSHSTLVTEAKTPNTNINDVKFEAKTTPKAESRYSKDQIDEASVRLEWAKDAIQDSGMITVIYQGNPEYHNNYAFHIYVNYFDKESQKIVGYNFSEAFAVLNNMTWTKYGGVRDVSEDDGAGDNEKIKKTLEDLFEDSDISINIIDSPDL